MPRWSSRSRSLASATNFPELARLPETTPIDPNYVSISTYPPYHESFTWSIGDSGTLSEPPLPTETTPIDSATLSEPPLPTGTTPTNTNYVSIATYPPYHESFRWATLSEPPLPPAQMINMSSISPASLTIEIHPYNIYQFHIRKYRLPPSP